MEFFNALWQQPFLQNAFIGGLLACVGCGIMGTYVVVKRISFLAGGIAHAVLSGMGVAYYLGHNPIFGAVIAAVIAAILIGWIHLRWRENEDTVIAAMWSMGMAIGVVFISQTPGYNVDLMSYLFGNILMVPRDEIWLMLALDLVIIATVVFFYKPILAVCFDEEFARLRGVRVEWVYMVLLVLVALTVVLLIQVVGLILVIALLTIPAAIASHYVGSLFLIMVIAVGLGALFTTAGLALSYTPDLPAGATIILVAGAAYFLSTALSSLVNKKIKSRRSKAGNTRT